MADTKITALTALTAADPANDVIPIVDVSDTTMAASGTTKKISVNNILGASGTATLASATISGDLTVRTTKLAVTSTGVGVGTVTPNSPSHFYGSGRVMQFQPAASTASTFLAFSSDNFVSNRALVGIDGSASSIWAVGGVAYSLNIGTVDSNSICFGASNAELYRIAPSGVFNWYNGAGGTRMTLDSTGLGVGVTPSAWASKAFQVGTYAGLHTNDSLGSSELIYNCYRSTGATWNYINTDTAARYRMWNSTHAWFTAPTGTAGNAISFGDAKMTLDASGNLLVGTTSNPAHDGFKAFFYNNGNNTLISQCDSANFCLILYTGNGTNTGTAASFRHGTSGSVGSIVTTSSSTSYLTSSDYRLKEAVEPMSGGLARVNALKPSIYKWKADGSSGEGFLAHELAEVVPAAVSGEKNAVNADGTINPQGVDLSKIVPILVAAIQELTARVQTLEAR